jgi:hypothetical protein
MRTPALFQLYIARPRRVAPASSWPPSVVSLTADPMSAPAACPKRPKMSGMPRNGHRNVREMSVFPPHRPPRTRHNRPIQADTPHGKSRATQKSGHNGHGRAAFLLADGRRIPQRRARSPAARGAARLFNASTRPTRRRPPARWIRLGAASQTRLRDYFTLIVTLCIASPGLIFFTTSMPCVTWPKI